uniref:IS4 family transposase n=1 Tax=Haemonchus placei TaxID=6290 RepID=A0A0N4WQ05_HAEPC
LLNRIPFVTAAFSLECYCQDHLLHHPHHPIDRLTNFF